MNATYSSKKLKVTDGGGLLLFDEEVLGKSKKPIKVEDWVEVVVDENFLPIEGPVKAGFRFIDKPEDETAGIVFNLRSGKVVINKLSLKKRNCFMFPYMEISTEGKGMLGQEEDDEKAEEKYMNYVKKILSLPNSTVRAGVMVRVSEEEINIIDFRIFCLGNQLIPFSKLRPISEGEDGFDDEELE